MFREYPINKILRQLERANLLPGLVFRTSRKQCDLDIQQISRKSYLKIQEEQQAAIQETVAEVIARHSWEANIFEKHLQYNTLIHFGIGAHHAGQLLPWRLLLEELMSRGLLRLMIATGTVAAGVDFPARTAVITSHSKRGHEGFKVLAPSEFQQMSGRAGRRGKDTVGFCLMAPNPYCDARILADVAKTPPEPLKSAYFASPSTVLNLLKYRDIEDLKYTVENSLAGFVDAKEADLIEKQADEHGQELSNLDPESQNYKKLNKKIRRINRQAGEVRGQQMQQLDATLDALKKLDYLNENGKLTEKGSWSAELCTSLVLELAEAIDNFLLSDLSLQQLVGIVASISGDHHRSYLTIKKTVLKQDLLDELDKKVELVAESYPSNQYANEVAVLPDAAATVEAWLESDSWTEFSSLLRLANVADGDAARLITQTADQLQQISRLQDSHPDLAREALEARSLLLKPPLADSV